MSYTLVKVTRFYIFAKLMIIFCGFTTLVLFFANFTHATNGTQGTGRSNLFADIFCGGRVMGNCDGLKLDSKDQNPLEKILKGLNDYSRQSLSLPMDSGFDLQANIAFIPDGRSLQNTNTDYVNPRVVMSPFQFGDRQNNGKLFVGYSANKNELEVMIENSEGVNEFFLVSDFPKNPKLNKVEPQQTCLSCHVDGKAIFSAGPWSETNVNPRVAYSLCKEQGRLLREKLDKENPNRPNKSEPKYSNVYQGVPFVENCKDIEDTLVADPFATRNNKESRTAGRVIDFDNSVRANQNRQQSKGMCEKICPTYARGASPAEKQASLKCQQLYLELYLLSPSPLTLGTLPREGLEKRVKENLNTGFLVGMDTFDVKQRNTYFSLLDDYKKSLPNSIKEHFKNGTPTNVLADREPNPPLGSDFSEDLFRGDRKKTVSAQYEKLKGSIRLFKIKEGELMANGKKFTKGAVPDYSSTFDNNLGPNLFQIFQPQVPGTPPQLGKESILRSVEQVFLTSSEGGAKFDFTNPKGNVHDYNSSQIPAELAHFYLANNAGNCFVEPFASAGILKSCAPENIHKAVVGFFKDSRIAQSNELIFQRINNNSADQQIFVKQLEKHCPNSFATTSDEASLRDVTDEPPALPHQVK